MAADLNFDENAQMTKEEEEQLQERLKAASKNTQVFQNKVRDLNNMVDHMMKRKENAEEELARKMKQLAEVTEHLNGIKGRYNATRERLASNQQKAKTLRKLIAESEETFSGMVRRTRSLNSLTLYKTKETETNLVGRDLEADRGYTCKKGSTFGHLAAISAKSFF